MNTTLQAKRIALVTGASRGIGRAASLALAKAGYHVILSARTTGALEELDDEIRAAGGSASILRLDLTEGATIIKYGQDVGRVVAPAAKGRHVHTHNMKTKRW